jgi:Sec7-like guanine-nucleotide exchange factor
MIGVFLGTDDKLPKACLYRFIEEFDLKGVAYVQSLKTILQGFRLPGEG